MPAPTLSKMATRACIKNIRSITDVGDAPYQLVRAILLRVENPQQLRQIELASPQICGQDGEIWLEFIKRDVQNWEQKAYEPANPKKWYQAYKKLLMHSQKEVEDDAAELKATMDRIKHDQALHKAQQVELKGVPVPEGMKSKGPTISLSTMPKLYEKPSYPPPNPNPKKRKITRKVDPDDPDNPGKLMDPYAKPIVSKLDRFRKEAKAMGHFKPSARPGVWTAKDMMSRRTITKKPVIIAPRILIEEHRKAANPPVLDPSVKPAIIFTPKKKRVSPDETTQPGGLTIEEREQRLKAFTNPSSARKPSTPGASTTPKSDSATSPPDQKTKASSPTASKLATSPAPNVQAIPRLSSPLKRKDGASPPLGYTVPRANTSSPSNGGLRPPMITKKKAPVDVFMPAKRRKIA